MSTVFLWFLGGDFVVWFFWGLWTCPRFSALWFAFDASLFFVVLVHKACFARRRLYLTKSGFSGERPENFVTFWGRFANKWRADRAPARVFDAGILFRTRFDKMQFVGGMGGESLVIRFRCLGAINQRDESQPVVKYRQKPGQVPMFARRETKLRSKKFYPPEFLNNRRWLTSIQEICYSEGDPQSLPSSIAILNRRIHFTSQYIHRQSAWEQTVLRMPLESTLFGPKWKINQR